MKEVTNKLDIGPAKFKSSWTGLKLSAGIVSRDKCDQQKLNFEGLKRGESSRPLHVDNVCLTTGPSTSRPLDQLDLIKGRDDLGASQSNCGGKGERLEQRVEHLRLRLLRWKKRCKKWSTQFTSSVGPVIKP